MPRAAALGRLPVLAAAAALCVAVYLWSRSYPQEWGVRPEVTSVVEQPLLPLDGRVATPIPCATDTSRRAGAGLSVGLVSPHLGTTNDFMYIAKRLGLDVTVSTRKQASWSSRAEALQVCVEVCVCGGGVAFMMPLTAAAAVAATAADTGVGAAGRNVLQALRCHCGDGLGVDGRCGLPPSVICSH